MKQLGAYSLGLEHTIGVVPEIFMIFVATQERAQVFAVQGGTLQKWQNKWLKDVEKYYTQIVNQPPEIDFEVVDGDA
jgi:adenosine/AMP kinase